ncbi:hypothetical protein FHW79_005229 [Azospirillum sp. OGB3]|nr:hypothetical protein [Azospirillum sp. OGB3]MBB3267568.1 hypothetical protein [Azospirillum sp. OGB3]
MGIKRDGQIVMRGILPDGAGDSLARRVRACIKKLDAKASH